MRKVIVLMHESLDGMVAGPNGEMDWIQFDEEMTGYVSKATQDADAAIYGRVTYQMMESYWPTAAENPNATRHDIDHANWVNQAQKIVFSRTMERSDWKGTVIMKDIVRDEIESLKKQQGKNLLLIGSASIVHAFIELDLIDEYWINVNPVLLGKGKPMFRNIKNRQNLNLTEAKNFNGGVMGLKYERLRK
jgi:dihydrofolate reductase